MPVLLFYKMGGHEMKAGDLIREGDVRAVHVKMFKVHFHLSTPTN